MSSVHKALKDIRKTLILSKLYNSFLNGLVVFVIFALFFIIVRTYWWLALIPFFIYMVYGIYNAFMKSRYSEIEEKVPDLKWQLRTMADNAHQDNEVVQSLKHNVLQKLQHVGSSHFYDNKKTVYKIGAVFCASFFIILIGILNVEFVEFTHVNPGGISEKLTQLGDSITGKIAFEGLFDGGNERDIYGAESVAELGNEELELKITQDNSKIDISDINDIQNPRFNKQGQIQDIGAAGGLAYENEKKLDSDEAELIKDYFGVITNTINTEE